MLFHAASRLLNAARTTRFSARNSPRWSGCPRPTTRRTRTAGARTRRPARRTAMSRCLRGAGECAIKARPSLSPPRAPRERCKPPMQGHGRAPLRRRRQAAHGAGEERDRAREHLPQGLWHPRQGQRAPRPSGRVLGPDEQVWVRQAPLAATGSGNEPCVTAAQRQQTDVAPVAAGCRTSWSPISRGWGSRSPRPCSARP